MMPYFKLNADKNAYQLSSIEKETDGVHYAIYASRFEEHWKNCLGTRRLQGRTHHYSFRVPSAKKMDFKFDNAVYSAKKADKMTVERLVNHLQTLADLSGM